MPEPSNPKPDADPPPAGPEGDAQVRPRDLHLNLKAQELVITWQDGRRSRFELGRLRRVCPCATCRRDRAAPSTRLPILSNAAAGQPIAVIDAELVGHYAVHLKWTDGHDTGIYDFRYLRALDQPDASGSSGANRSA